jgi:opacity protein-like surface antigen
MKNKTKPVVVILILILGFSGGLLAQSKVGTTSAQFLKIGIGPRAAAMGDAFVAIANDATALYWNPAGIAGLTSNQVFLTYNDWIAGISHSYGAIVMPLAGIGTVGASITSVNMEEMKVRTETMPDGTGEMFNVSNLAVAGSFARSLTDRFAIGVNAKYVREQIWHMSASAFAIDIGTVFKTRFKDMRIGMCISNFGSNMRMEGRDALVKYDPDPYISGNNNNINAHLDTENWPLPLTFRVGVALDLINNPFMRITTALDAAHPNDLDEYLNFGTEIAWNEIIFLRAGIRQLGNDTFAGKKLGNTGSLTLGAGLNYQLLNNLKIGIDWAFVDYGRLEKTQRFSLLIAF